MIRTIKEKTNSLLKSIYFKLKYDISFNENSDYGIIKDSGLYNLNYYCKQTKINFKSEKTGIMHYLEYGSLQKFNPSKQFNGNDYLSKYHDVKDAGMNPLVHYLKFGKKEHRTDKYDQNTQEYDIVEKSQLYDHEYYIDQLKTPFKSPRTGLMHYLEYGFTQGYNPSEKFDGDAYLTKYEDVRQSKMNPLVHYLNYGKVEGRIGITSHEYKNFKQIQNVNQTLNKINERITIIIFMSTIDNTKSCINNIINTTKNFEIYVIINDKYPKKNYNELILSNNIKIIKPNQFNHIINNFISRLENDIVILKDNIQTFKNWILKLTAAAYSNERIGFVSPLSNYSPISLTDKLSKINEESSDLISKISKKEYVESTFPNYSCIFIKKDVFKGCKVTKKNNDNEEWLINFYNDSIDKGWKSVFDDSTIVYYHQNKPRIYKKDEFKLLDPFNFENMIESDFVNSYAFNETYKNLSSKLKKEGSAKKRILFILHNSGGVEFTTKDIAKAISDEYDCYILKSFGNILTLTELIDGEFITLKEYSLKYEWNPKMIRNSEFKQLYFYIIFNYDIDLIHVDHLLYNTFDIVDIAKLMDIPIVLALHDFYFICQTIFLLDENNNVCNGHCGNKLRNCSENSGLYELPVNMSEWKSKWKQHVTDLFNNVSCIVTATEFTKNLFLEHYSNLSNEDIELIEHGRDLIKYDQLNTIPNTYQPSRILIPGTIKIHKGSEFIKELFDCDKDNKLEFHFIGRIGDDLKGIGQYHGPYNRENFAKFVYKIKPSFIGIFPICPETYSHTLTESLSTGVPVLASNLGALKYRIEKEGGGWLVDINNSQKTYNQILNIIKDKNEYLKIKNEVDSIKATTTKDMGDKYIELYTNLLKK